MITIIRNYNQKDIYYFQEQYLLNFSDKNCLPLDINFLPM